MSKKLKIDTMYAFIAENEEGEGVTAFLSPAWPDVWLPMVAADIARVESLMPIAENIARETGKPINLVQFTERKLIKVIK